MKITGAVVKHREWLVLANARWNDTFRIYQEDLIPTPIQVFMLTAPLKHLLRCIYGSDLSAALHLLGQALGESGRNLRVAARICWHRRILRRSEADTLNRIFPE